MRTLALVPFLLLLLAVAGCTGNEIVGLHVAVQPDGSAAITAKALTDSTAPSPAELHAKGVVWGKRAALVHTQGVVQKLEDLRFGDDSFVIKPKLDAQKITVVLQRGEKVGWLDALVPDKQTRRDLAVVYDPLGKTKEIADVLRLEFVLPRAVVGSDVQRTARGVAPGKEGNRAYLSIPAETAREKGDPIVWDITWVDG
jgi:hypothetical protein